MAGRRTVAGAAAGGLALALVAAAPAHAAVPAGILGLPSVEDLVGDVVRFFFEKLADALVPDFLKEASVDAIKFLVALPNPANSQRWPHVAQLRGYMVWLAAALVPLLLQLAATRYWLGSFSGAPAAVSAAGRAVVAVGGLVVYHWAFANTIAGVNTITNAILSAPVVGDGLERMAGTLFSGALLGGAGSVFLAVLSLFAIALGTVLFLLKVATLMLTAILYVAGPLAIAFWILEGTAHYARMWAFALGAVALIPISWCVIFATAGALALDVSNFGALGRQGGETIVPNSIMAAFAGLIAYGLAVMWPLKLLRMIGATGGFRAAGGRGAVVAGGGGAVAQRVGAARARLQAGALAGGRVLGSAAGALGAPAGGPVGAATRAIRGVRAGGGAATATGGPSNATAAAVPGAAAGASASGAEALQPAGATPLASDGSASGRGAARERVARAGEVLRQGPAEVRAAAAAAGGSPRGRTGGAPGDPPAHGGRGNGCVRERLDAPGRAGAAGTGGQRPSAAGAGARPAPARENAHIVAAVAARAAGGQAPPSSPDEAAQRAGAQPSPARQVRSQPPAAAPRRERAPAAAPKSAAKAVKRSRKKRGGGKGKRS